MSTLLQTSIKLSTFKSISNHEDLYKKQTFSFSPLVTRLASSIHGSGFSSRVYGEARRFREGVLLEERICRGKKKGRRMVLVKNNQGFGFNGGGGGGRDNGTSARLLVNLALAVGLTYLSMTGQLGWILDAIVSIWIFAVLIPIVGIGAFLWWAGRDMMQAPCPNCGNQFQVFKSTINEELQLCPFCGQPFSVVGNEFVKDSVKFSNQSTTFGQAFNDFTRSRNDVTGKDSGGAIDVEAEIKDAD